MSDDIIEESKTFKTNEKAFDFGDVEIYVVSKDDSKYIQSRVHLICTIIRNLFSKKVSDDEVEQ